MSAKTATHAPIARVSGEKVHAIAKFDVTNPGSPFVAGVHEGKRSLALGPVVDRAGYTIVLRKSQGQCSGGGNCSVVVDRRHELDFAPAGLGDVGAQL